MLHACAHTLFTGQRERERERERKREIEKKGGRKKEKDRIWLLFLKE